MLVALIQAESGAAFVYIEQPELHLHPPRAVETGEHAANGVWLVIKTHSSLLLRGILTQIAESRSQTTYLARFKAKDGSHQFTRKSPILRAE